MKTKNYLTLVAIMSLTFFTACDKDDDSSDTTAPVIRLISPANEAILMSGDEEGFLFEAEFSDNVGLKSCKVNIHSAGDGHTHSRSEHTSGSSYQYNKTWSLNGQKEDKIQERIVIPEKLDGEYHLMVYCSDSAGNESQVVIHVTFTHEEE